MPEKLKLRTPAVRLRYPNFFTARMPKEPKPGQKARFDTTGLILPVDKMIASDQVLYKALRAACLVLAVDKLGREKVATMLKENTLKLPFKTDVQTKGHPPEFAEYIKPWTEYQPGVVSVYRDPTTGKPATITDPSKVYGGLWARLTVQPGWYDRDGNKGVNLMLSNVLMIVTPAGYSNERISGPASAEDEFADEGIDGEFVEKAGAVTSAAANPAGIKDELSDLLGTG